MDSKAKKILQVKTAMVILDAIRDNHGSIRQFAMRNGYAREIVYQSANGAGSIKCRLEIAQILGKKPSEIWQQRNGWINQRDDAIFLGNKK